MPILSELTEFYASGWQRYRLALITAHGAKCSVLLGATLHFR